MPNTPFGIMETHIHHNMPTMKKIWIVSHAACTKSIAFRYAYLEGIFHSICRTRTTNIATHRMAKAKKYWNVTKYLCGNSGSWYDKSYGSCVYIYVCRNTKLHIHEILKSTDCEMNQFQGVSYWEQSAANNFCKAIRTRAPTLICDWISDAEDKHLI